MQFETYRGVVTAAGTVYLIDRLTKLLVMWLLHYAQQYVVFDGFFKFVHWGNTGAAWSMFYGNNTTLAVISVLALVVLGLSAREFDIRSSLGKVALGMVMGGILGNLTDRLRYGHVVDFLRFYLYQRGGDEIGFPAFNMADSAICIGVFLLLIASRRQTSNAARPSAPIA